MPSNHKDLVASYIEDIDKIMAAFIAEQLSKEQVGKEIVIQEYNNR